MRFSISIMQIIAIVWTAMAVVLALVIVTSMSGMSLSGIPWQFSVLMFFVFLLFLFLPVYLLLYFWHSLSRKSKTMNEIKKCPKCRGKMDKGSDQTLDDAFRCTRGGTEGPERLEKYDFGIQPYYCENCGYIEFFKEKKV